MANKKTLFSIAVVINSDGTYQDKIVLEPGGEVLAATFLFNMINGTVSSTILDYIKKKYHLYLGGPLKYTICGLV